MFLVKKDIQMLGILMTFDYEDEVSGLCRM